MVLKVPLPPGELSELLEEDKYLTMAEQIIKIRFSEPPANYGSFLIYL